MGNNRPIENSIHRNWWTTLLALPTGTDTPGYAALRRVWADNTINTVYEDEDGGLRSKAKRGIYRTDSEDHLMVALFENWAALPDCSWVTPFLGACGIRPNGDIQAVGWSYEYTQDRPGKKPGKLTADIVVCWRDQDGDAVLVLEAKKPGNRLWGEKDLPDSSPYCDVPGFDGIERCRRHTCMLVAADDAVAMASLLRDQPVLTWERLLSLQAEAFGRMPVPDALRAFLIGAIVHQGAGYGIIPTPLPLGWMAEQPTSPNIKDEAPQTRVDRRIAYWRPARQVMTRRQ